MKHTHRRPLSLAALALSALLLAGCGDGGGGAGEDAATDPAGTSAPVQDTATPDDSASPDGSASPDDDATDDGTAGPSGSASPSGSAGSDAPGGGDAAVVSSAVAAAEDAVGGDARVFELGREDSPASWQVAVTADDREHELYVSQDGTDVISQEEEGALDGDDRDRLARVRVPLEDGVRTALGTVNGTLDEVQLETEDGTTVWEVEIEEPNGNSVDVFVDVENGSVLKIDR